MAILPWKRGNTYRGGAETALPVQAGDFSAIAAAAAASAAAAAAIAAAAENKEKQDDDDDPPEIALIKQTAQTGIHKKTSEHTVTTGVRDRSRLRGTRHRAAFLYHLMTERRF